MSEIVRGSKLSVDNDQTKELFNLMYEVRDRTTRIEAETQRLGTIERKVDKADTKANEALLKSNNNEKENEKTNQALEKTQDNMRNMWLTFIGFAISIISLAVKIFM